MRRASSTHNTSGENNLRRFFPHKSGNNQVFGALRSIDREGLTHHLVVQYMYTVVSSQPTDYTMPTQQVCPSRMYGGALSIIHTIIACTYFHCYTRTTYRYKIITDHTVMSFPLTNPKVLFLLIFPLKIFCFFLLYKDLTAFQS